MSESYKGFKIEYERTDAASLYSWSIIGINGHVYHCGGSEYETEYDAWSAATKWINSYIKTLPATQATRIALQVQQKLSDVEESLQVITGGDYLNHYRRIASEEIGNVEALLLDAGQKIQEAMKINEMTIRAIKRFPHEDVQVAVQRYLFYND